jgi:histidinol-phosphate/aromatic aminotransferase/cobyric acid decarboxylase-like protein
VLPFPLAAWIEGHARCRYNLGESGMLGSLRSTPRLLRRLLRASPGEVVRRIAGLHQVALDRVFLTHGATEANALVLLYLVRRARAAAHHATARIEPPEYPSLREAAMAVGFRVGSDIRGADVAVISNPNNPTGRWVAPDELVSRAHDARELVVDETFREYGPHRSVAAEGGGVWTTGSLTKSYGADEVRLGWAIAPPEQAGTFGRFHGIVADPIPDLSLRSAAAVLRHRDEVLAETRRIVGANLRHLREAVPDAPSLAAPVWFDRGRNGLPGDALALAGLRRSVLVSPGSFFGDARGVRVTLTRRTFARDLAHYLPVRARFL